jgi:hypothetical protein
VSVSGNASQLAAWAEQHRVELDRFVKRLAQGTGRPVEHVEADLAMGRWLGAEDALRYGLVDEIWRPGGPAAPPPPGPPSSGPPSSGPASSGPASGPARPFGFGPAR